jgi:hypothetical protein
MCFLGVAGGLLWAPVALADRPSTPEEHQALAAAAGRPPDCVQTRISEVDSAWAKVRESGCDPEEAITLWHLNAGAWSVVYDGPDAVRACPLSAAVPDAIARDFRMCRPPSRRVYAMRGVRFVYKPRVLGLGAHIVFRDLRWSRWGRASTSARTTLDYVDRTTSFRAPVRITLSRIRTCGVNRRVYTRQTVRAVRASDRARLRFATGSITLRCPSQT